MASKKFHFRCKSNLNGPLLTLETAWEAREMANHPDYERIDENGEVIEDEMNEAEKQTIPVDAARRPAAA